MLDEMLIYILKEKKHKRLESGRIISLKIDNGHHIINGDQRGMSYPSTSDSISFNSNNERIIITVNRNSTRGQIEFSIVNITPLLAMLSERI